MIDRLYRDHIRPLPVRERLRLAERIIAEAAESELGDSRCRSLLELEGLGAELWEGIDAQVYVDELRDEWSMKR
jgi:hypothetical protein